MARPLLPTGFEIASINLKGLAKGRHLRDLPEIELQAEMILVTCSGTIARTQIIPAYMQGWTASQDAHRIVPLDQQTAGYLYAWLSSAYGQAFILRHTYGSVVQHIDIDQLGRVPVPFPSDEVRSEIAAPVLRANELRTEAWYLEREAIGRLETLIAGA